MKILRILGIVAAAHVVAITLLFAIQGCSSTSKSVPPTVAATTDNPSAAVQFNSSNDPAPVTPPAGADLNPATAPEALPVSLASSPVLYSPTRPGTSAAAAIEASTPLSNVTPVATYVVAKGDSLSKIAGKYHLTRSELAKANGLKSNSTIKIGQKLIIPGKASPAGTTSAAASATDAGTSGATIYKVKAGDSLRLIAKHNGTTLAALRSLNHLKSDSVRVGQQLKIPSGATPAVSPVAAETAATPDTTTAAPVKNADGLVTHTVKAGEKLGAIAKKYGVTVGELATANNISDPGKIRAGQQLVIPNGTAASSKPATVSTPAETETPTPPASGDLDNGLKPTATEPPVIKVDDATAAPAPMPDAPPPTTDNSATPTTP
ncbi:MAG TPA: LysM peptidoglycan-binding domain-containing protein [Opitutaceae bacterium]|nr:LysM peptidoglycan-binding domain-containing protein [Opitutaceae bacterium]